MTYAPKIFTLVVCWSRGQTLTHTHTPFPPKVHDPFHDRCSVQSNVRVHVCTSRRHIPRTSIVGATQNFQVILNICQTGAAKRGRGWASGGMFEGGRCTSSTLAPPYLLPSLREMELRVLAEILCLSLARNIRALSPKRHGKRNPIAESTVNYIVPRENKKGEDKKITWEWWYEDGSSLSKIEWMDLCYFGYNGDYSSLILFR